MGITTLPRLSLTMAQRRKSESLRTRLRTIPDLTVEYLTEGNRIDAGVYTTKAVFKIAQPYATNYVLPTEDDDGSYNGEFAFNCTWAINKAELNIEWNTPDSGSSSNLVYIPRLKVGHEYVNYVYERKVGSTWVTATELKADARPKRSAQRRSSKTSLQRITKFLPTLTAVNSLSKAVNRAFWCTTNSTAR